MLRGESSEDFLKPIQGDGVGEYLKGEAVVKDELKCPEL